MKSVLLATLLKLVREVIVRQVTPRSLFSLSLYDTVAGVMGDSALTSVSLIH